MELSFQAVLRPGRLEPELRTHRKDQENAEVIPGSAGILRALLIIAKPSARWKRALPGKGFICGFEPGQFSHGF